MPTVCPTVAIKQILWKAVREFWIALLPYFEKWQEIKALPDQISDLKQRVTELDQRCTALELAAENGDKQRQQISIDLQVKQQEIAELQMMLREANERNTEERERSRVLLARHSASVRPPPLANCFEVLIHQGINLGNQIPCSGQATQKRA